MNTNEWNYKIPPPVQLWNSQKDWNQTLHTKLNELSVEVNGEIEIKSPVRFKSLFESLEFYDSKSNKLGNRFNFSFFSSDENVIYVGDNLLNIYGI